MKTLTGGVAGLMKKNKIDVIHGTASLAGKGRVAVDGNEVEAEKVVLELRRVVSIPGDAFQAECRR